MDYGLKKNFIFGDLQIVALHPFYLGRKAQKKVWIEGDGLQISKKKNF
jgi:hypothetical protein